MCLRYKMEVSALEDLKLILVTTNTGIPPGAQITVEGDLGVIKSSRLTVSESMKACLYEKSEILVILNGHTHLRT